jgi:DinB superfamily
MPPKLEAAVSNLTDAQLDTPYRDGGWTVRQLVHHIADSHMNAYTRFKLTLTEDHPTIRPYEEWVWAELPDAQGPIGTSLTLIRALHERWGLLLATLTEADYKRTLFHPEWGDMTLWALLDNYQWHSRHHVAHVTSLRDSKGW